MAESDDQSTKQDPEDQSAEFADVIAHRQRRAVRQFRANVGGRHPRHCPICGYYGTFTPFGLQPRFDAHCAKCGSLERHRLMMLLMLRTGIIGPSHRVLHFAPERGLRGAISARAGEYLTADLTRRNVDRNLDIEAIDLEDESFDRIVCFQVLEHVDDRKALAEMFRVLKPGGVALLNTPVIEGWDKTYEDDSITDPKMRLLHFGQADHRRFFGRDIRERMTGAGFELEEFVSEEPDVTTYGLVRGERIFLARKPLT